MKNSEIQSLTDKELAEKLASLKSELFNLRFSHASGSLTNNMELSACKRNIARVKTVMRQRELGISAAPVKVADKKAAAEKKTAEKKTAEKKATADKKAAAEKKSTKKSAKVDAEVKG